jgi:hypothetical protein
MASIICDASPFCFGPISKLITIANYLSEHHDITFLASGTSYELAKKANFNVIECNTLYERELRQHEKLIRESSLYVNVMNRRSSAFVHGKTPQAFVDSLFHMWDSIPDHVLKSDFYFIQNFTGMESQHKKFDIKNKIVVGPIIDDRFVDRSGEKKNQLLVDFGGMESRYTVVGEHTNYPFIVSDLIIESLENYDVESIVFAGSARPMKLLKKRHVDKYNVDFRSFSHEYFLKELSKTKYFLKSPGLTSTFESFFYGVPTYFLPPQNYSQSLNLLRLRNNNVASKSIDWVDFYKDSVIDDNQEETVGVASVLDSISRFEKDTVSQERFKTILKGFFETDDHGLIEKQYDFFDGCGNNGAREIVRHINLFLGE